MDLRGRLFPLLCCNGLRGTAIIRMLCFEVGAEDGKMYVTSITSSFVELIRDSSEQRVCVAASESIASRCCILLVCLAWLLSALRSRVLLYPCCVFVSVGKTRRRRRRLGEWERHLLRRPPRHSQLLLGDPGTESSLRLMSH